MSATPWALHDGRRGWTTAELATEVDALAVLLRQRQVHVLATLMDNSPAWVVADRAAAVAGLVHVPLPGFFTPAQVGSTRWRSRRGRTALLVRPATPPSGAVP